MLLTVYIYNKVCLPLTKNHQHAFAHLPPTYFIYQRAANVVEFIHRAHAY